MTNIAKRNYFFFSDLVYIPLFSDPSLAIAKGLLLYNLKNVFNLARYLKARAVNKNFCEPGAILPTSLACYIGSTYLTLPGAGELKQISSLILASLFLFVSTQEL